jgi:citrate lyase subunit beta/citryl-CoA lyase
MSSAEPLPPVQMTRSMMFIPASNAAMLSTAVVYGADKYMFDLEDAVSPREKDSARLLAFHAIGSPVWRDHEIVVRINGIGTPYFDDDVEAMVRAGASVIRLPMTQDGAMIEQLDAKITQVEKACGREVGSTKCMAAIESAVGVVNAVQIATASPRMVAIAIAAFDYLLDMHATRSSDGAELFYARCAVLHAARYAKLAAYDVVYGDVEDEEGFIREAERGKQLGFDGKSLVNPRQIPLLHNVYAPTQAELDHARRVVAAAEDALARGVGAITVDGAMVDGPIIDAARRVVAYAAQSGVRK